MLRITFVAAAQVSTYARTGCNALTLLALLWQTSSVLFWLRCRYVYAAAAGLLTVALLLMAHAVRRDKASLETLETMMNSRMRVRQTSTPAHGARRLVSNTKDAGGNAKKSRARAPTVDASITRPGEIPGRSRSLPSLLTSKQSARKSRPLRARSFVPQAAASSAEHTGCSTTTSAPPHARYLRATTIQHGTLHRSPVYRIDTGADAATARITTDRAEGEGVDVVGTARVAAAAAIRLQAAHRGRMARGERARAPALLTTGTGTSHAAAVHHVGCHAFHRTDVVCSALTLPVAARVHLAIVDLPAPFPPPAPTTPPVEQRQAARLPTRVGDKFDPRYGWRLMRVLARTLWWYHYSRRTRRRLQLAFLNEHTLVSPLLHTGRMGCAPPYPAPHAPSYARLCWPLQPQ